MGATFPSLHPKIRQWFNSIEHEPAADRYRSWLSRIGCDQDIYLTLTVVDVIVVIADKTYIYSGVIKMIDPDKTGNPEYFELVSVQRKKFDHETDSDKVEIPGRSFFIKRSELTTINVGSYKIVIGEQDA